MPANRKLKPSDSPEPTLAAVLRAATSRLRSAGLHFGHGTDNARDEAAYLVLHTLELPPDDLESVLQRRLHAREVGRIDAILRRRIKERRPAAYLTREAWLGPLRFFVDERVIVPRSFIAELLRDALAPWIEDSSQPRRILDLCTGSGCLAILAAHTFARAQVDAVDLSGPALQVARRNVRAYALQPRVHLLRSDLFSGLGMRRYDLILSNPPYVDAPAMAKLPREYRREPRLALAGGRDGLRFIRRILREAHAHLNPQGLLVVEIGHNRGALEAAYPRLPFVWLETSAGADYVFLLRKEDLP